jgi:hypothetical protein
VRYEPYNPNRRRLWLIPVLLAAQLALKLLVFDRVIQEDSIYGDSQRRFDEKTVKCVVSITDSTDTDTH